MRASTSGGKYCLEAGVTREFILVCGCCLNKLIDDGVCRDALTLCGKADDNSVSQDRGGESLNILDGNM